MRGGGAAPSRHKHAIQNEPEADFNVQMALVEILILLERYQEAAEFSCLNYEHGQISDVRIPLYKVRPHHTNRRL
ncbi:unnamed protein product [Brassica oleracea var. botrytis]